MTAIPDVTLPTADQPSYLRHLPALARQDVTVLLQKDREYGSSWKRRGGVGAFFVAIRKADRLEESARRYHYNIFAALHADGRPESILDDIQDLRRYLLLIEAEFLEQQAQQQAAPGAPVV